MPATELTRRRDHRPAKDGLLVVDKPEGPTSHDLVDLARRALRTRRVGHAGTLDPIASGVMLLLVGRATRLARLLTGHEKSYEGEARLGWSTDTYDRTGQPDGPVPGEPVRVDETELARHAAALTGAYLQTPPRFSARKQGGEPLHRRVRRGEQVEARPTPVSISVFHVHLLDDGLVGFSCRVSSGTYVRSLVHDLGRALGCGAHLTALRRTDVGGLGLDRAAAIDELRRDPVAILRGPAFFTFDEIPLDLPVVRVRGEAVRDLRHGRPFDGDLARAGGGPELQVRDEAGHLLALAEPAGPEGLFQPRTVFPSPPDAGFTPSP